MYTEARDSPITNHHHERTRPIVAGNATSTVTDACLTVIMSLPVALRALVVMAAVVAGSLFLYEKYWPQPLVEPHADVIGQGHMENATAYTGGRPDPKHAGSDSNNPQNLEADHKASEDAEAYKWHFNHQTEDNPPEVAIGSDTDPGNYIHYRFFEKTDRCVFVKRRAEGTDLTQWVRDPKHHEHDFDLHVHPTAQPSAPQVQSRASIRLFDSLVPVVAASTLPGNPTVAREAQASSCINPHPGDFKYWWGAPIDQCNSPMYRQFRDGCTHYQIYNRCASAWDARIFWTSCHTAPHSD